MAGTKKKKNRKPVFLTVRRFWTRNPVTRIKKDEKKEAIIKACRKKTDGEPDC